MTPGGLLRPPEDLRPHDAVRRVCGARLYDGVSLAGAVAPRRWPRGLRPRGRGVGAKALSSTWDGPHKTWTHVWPASPPGCGSRCSRPASPPHSSPASRTCHQPQGGTPHRESARCRQELDATDDGGSKQVSTFYL